MPFQAFALPKSIWGECSLVIYEHVLFELLSLLRNSFRSHRGAVHKVFFRPMQAWALARFSRKKKSLPFPAGSRTSTQIQIRVRHCTHDDFTCSFVLLPERFGACAPYTFGIQLNGILQSALHVRFLAIPNTSTGETMW